MGARIVRLLPSQEKYPSQPDYLQDVATFLLGSPKPHDLITLIWNNQLDATLLGQLHRPHEMFQLAAANKAQLVEVATDEVNGVALAQLLYFRNILVVTACYRDGGSSHPHRFLGYRVYMPDGKVEDIIF